MRILAFIAVAFLGPALALVAGTAVADEGDGCASFTWDVAHELAVMKQVPQALNAAVKSGDDTPQMQTERLYELKLAPQASVSYPVAPGKSAPDDSAQGGLVQLRVQAAGIYRISLNSGHWIDVVADGRLIKSRAFQGARGCERPHKIVEFELPADTQLTLQFSGAASDSVLVAITAAPAPAAN